MDVRPHQTNLRKGRYSESRAYSITKCAAKGLCLTDFSIPEILIDSFFWMDSHEMFTVGAFVVMPDHYHLVMRLNQGVDLSSIMQKMGSFTANSINKKAGPLGEVWQRGYYDRAIRKSEDIRAVVEYIYNNPVRKGLVAKPEEWPYSSLNEEFSSRIRWHEFT